MFNPLLSFKTKKILASKARRKEFLNMQEIKSILILFDTEHFETVSAFVKQLRRMGKTVSAFAYNCKDDTENYSRIQYRIIPQKEVSKWFGGKLEMWREEICVQSFDVLFDMTVAPNPVLEYFVASADTALKIGYRKNNLPLYDITISSLNVGDNDENRAVAKLGKVILHYLSTINSTERNT